MATFSSLPMIKLFVVLLICSLLSSSIHSQNASTDMKWWCSHTPHPQTCEYYTSHMTLVKSLPHKSDFHKLAIRVALDRALHAQSHTLWLGSRCRNELEKVAWADCLELYEDTILLLNQTLNPSCTEVDTQTWLSAALTNLETCKTGFDELGVADYMLPLMSNNVSKLISNTLAINKVPPPEHEYKSKFPPWVYTRGRKLLQAASPASQADVVVVQDGSGDFRTIKEAVEAASKKKGNGRYVVHVKAGVYEENVVVSKKMKNIMFVGDGKGKTVIAGSRSVKGGSTTYNSATFAVTGDGFIARDMTFRNTAGPSGHQAVALRSGSDLSVFYRCSFEGYQDTLYVDNQRQFYKECDIYGTIDFIFGNAAVVFQSCNIYARRPMGWQRNTITAQGRIDPNQNTGISIHGCTITAGPDLKETGGSVQITYLGRPWKQYSRTVYMESFMDSLIAPAGWSEWNGDFALSTLYYGEYKNSGPGSATNRRVGWKGYRVITDPGVASQFTVGNFISGGEWLAATGVPYTAGLQNQP